MRPAAQISRRSVLAGSVLVVTGCRHKPATTRVRQVVSDGSALATARAGESALLTSYDAALATAVGAEAVRLTADRALHASHLAALGQSTSPAPVESGGDVGALLRSSAESLRNAAVDAADGAHAALFASIAASHEAMADG